MVRKTDVKKAPLTRELAQQFANYPSLPGERDLRKQRMSFLLKKLASGQFVGVSWALVLCKADGVTYRAEGRHSSTMLAGLADDVFPVGLIASIEMYECDSMEETAEVFDVFNNPQSVRGDEDMLGVRVAQSPFTGVRVLPRPFLTMVTRGISEYERVRRAKGATDALTYLPRDRGRYFMDPAQSNYAKMAEWLAQFRGLKNKKFLRRPGIVAVMLEQWIAKPTVEAFWLAVFIDGPDSNADARVLAAQYNEMIRLTQRSRIDSSVFRKKAAKALQLYTKAMETELEPV